MACYHGHAELAAGQGPRATDSGSRQRWRASRFTPHTVVLPYNDREADPKRRSPPTRISRRLVIVEPVPGNAGLYLRAGLLEFLREITKANGALLLFDEVMTGFPAPKGGAQERFGSTPDLSCLARSLGAACRRLRLGARAEIMDCLPPLGPVGTRPGTLSGNPLAMAAGIAALGGAGSGAKPIRNLKNSASPRSQPE